MSREQKRTVFRDKDGNVRWFSSEHVLGAWPTPAVEYGFAGFKNLLLLKGGTWLLCSEDPEERIEQASILTESQAVDWLLLNGYPPPDCLKCALDSKCLVQSGGEAYPSRHEVEDLDAGGMRVLDVAGATEWGPVHTQDGPYHLDGLPTWYNTEFLYRLASGHFVLYTERQHIEADFASTPTAKRLDNQAAVDWLVLNRFDPPVELRPLAEKLWFKGDARVVRGECDCEENAAQNERPHWDKERCRLMVGHQVVKVVRGRRTAPNVVQVLDRFQDSGWQHRVPSPFGNHETAKRALRETVRSLNKGLEPVLIRFSADGSGEGIVWDWTPPRTSRASPDQVDSIPF